MLREDVTTQRKVLASRRTCYYNWRELGRAENIFRLWNVDLKLLSELTSVAVYISGGTSRAAVPPHLGKIWNAGLALFRVKLEVGNILL